MSTETSQSNQSQAAPLPATPDEHMETRIQMQRIRDRTVGKNRMKLPCSKVTTAKNSENMVIELEHPVTGTERFYLSKPVHGWDPDQEWVEFLSWYGITPGGIYELQGGEMYRELQNGYDIYVEYDPDEDEWNLIEPPDTRSRQQKVRDLMNDPTRGLKYILRTLRQALGWISDHVLGRDVPYSRGVVSLAVFSTTFATSVAMVLQALTNTPISAVIIPAIMIGVVVWAFTVPLGGDWTNE